MRFFWHNNDILIAMLTSSEDLIESAWTELNGPLGNNKSVIIDFSQIHFLTSAGLVNLLMLWKYVTAQGAKMSLTGVNQEIQQILQTTNISGLIEFYPTTSTALARQAPHTTPTGLQTESTNLPSFRTAKLNQELRTTKEDDRSEDQRFANDWRFAYDKLAAGELADLRGKFVAIFNQSIVGVGSSESALRTETSRNAGCAAHQVVLLWVDDEDLR